MNKLNDKLRNLQVAYPSVFDSVIDTLVVIVEKTMDTIFIDFVEDLITRYDELSEEEQWMKFENEDFVVK